MTLLMGADPVVWWDVTWRVCASSGKRFRVGQVGVCYLDWTVSRFVPSLAILWKVVERCIKVVCTLETSLDGDGDKGMVD